MTDNHTPLLRLAGLKTSRLPQPSATAEELRPFITTLLHEAVPFIDTAAPRAADFSDPADPAPPASNTLWRSKGSKTLPESDAKVDISERVVTIAGSSNGAGGGGGGGGGGGEGGEKKGDKETWACRRSVHADSSTKGSASWAEFVECIRDRHAETEDAFTPSVVAHRTAVTWVDEGTAAAAAADGLEPVEAGGVLWGRFGLSLVEMKHKIPPPLKPRVFPVLQLIATAVPPRGGDSGGGGGGGTATGRRRDEFVVVSVTVGDFAEGGLKDMAGLSAEKKKGVVIGAYAAVERVRRLPGGEIEWVMATASDAKGVLPMWVQTRAIPGQIAKDVGLFLGWIAKEREREKERERGDGASSSTPAQGVEG
ncbi:hypothetical protein VP1G_07236 [Cytospora mali]|uniref:DUF3074 domain-containing protein n=1 Tax=Cytospora mali TaxID=578113 RepID=A0A194V7Z4_CYTMA|nr:hypothetical protein VP1G_07236 [Valsa mali var. pyri (nom. inval.)]